MEEDEEKAGDENSEETEDAEEKQETSEAIGEEQEQELSKEDLIRQYEAAVEEKEQLVQTNHFLQSKLAAYFSERQFEIPEDFLRKLGSDAEEEYQKMLNEIDSVLMNMKAFRSESEKETAEMETKLATEEQEVKYMSSQLQNLMRVVALRAVYSTTGGHIASEKVDFYLTRLDLEQKAKREACLEYTKEHNALEYIEGKKKEIADIKCPMNMNEYELMIAETHVQNSKAEHKKKVSVIDSELSSTMSGAQPLSGTLAQAHTHTSRNHCKEVDKLRVSCWDAVNVITHLKHKLFFVRKDKHEIKSRIKELKEEVDNMTEDLLAMKAEHEVTTKTQRQQLKQKFVMLQNEALPDDYDVKKVKYEELSKELSALKERYAKALQLMRASHGT